MSGPRAQPISLSALQSAALEQLVRRHSSPQILVRRAKIILAAADTVQNEPIARQLGCTRKTVRTWRARWAAAHATLACAEQESDTLLDQTIALLSDAPRSGAPDTFTAEQIVKIIDLACTPTSELERPVTAWTPRALADEAVKHGIVNAISPRSVDRFLKAGHAQTASESLLVEHQRT